MKKDHSNLNIVVDNKITDGHYYCEVIVAGKAIDTISYSTSEKNKEYNIKWLNKRFKKYKKIEIRMIYKF